MQQQSSKCFASIPLPPDPWVNRSKFPFQNIIMLHIKLNGIRICSNMIANILLADTPPPPTLGVKIQLFQNMVMLHIKLKVIANAATW